jgi:hypothetical protein
MRNVLRLVLERERGLEWFSSLSATQQSTIKRAGERASERRPNEELRDAFDAAGLAEIAGLIRSDQLSATKAIWPDKTAASVDLEPLISYRDKNLHAVGPPSGQITEDEIRAVLLRLRIGFEAIRRKLLAETNTWWPYIAAVHSNVPEYCFERSAGGRMTLSAVLVEGDLVTLDVVGVHPSAAAERLRYRVGFGGTAGRVRPPDVDWQASASFSFVVPRIVELSASVVVADAEDLGNGEYIALTAKVRPLP